MTVKLQIEKPVYGGDFISHHEKSAYFTPFVLPGEKIEAEIISSRRGVHFSNAVEILESSESRNVPECPNFGICGGCSYLHADYETEIALKKEIIQDSIKRIAKTEFHSEIQILTGPRFHYRSHAGIKSDGKTAGFYGRNSNRIIQFPEQGCLLLDSKINDYLRGNRPNADSRLAVDSEGRVRNSDVSPFTEKVGKFTYSRRLADFFQSNAFLRRKMLDAVCGIAENDCRGETLLDLGCGTGFFTIPLSSFYDYTLGVDIDKSNIRSAIKNKGLNETGKLFFEAADMAEINPPVKNFSTVIADPPRAGLGTKAVERITGFRPENIIYVSCNPATWARDMNQLSEKGYTLEKLIFIDMFPGTHHIELISLIRKKPFV